MGISEYEAKKENELIKVQGVVTNLRIIPAKENRDAMYIFEIDGVDYSGFGENNPFQDGDTVTFKYKQKGDYKNVVYVYNVNETSIEPKTADKLYKEEITLSANKSEIIILKEKFSDLLCASVRLCMKRNDMSDQSIEAVFQRLLKLSGIYIDWMTYTQLNHGGIK